MINYTNLSHAIRNVMEAGIVSTPRAINTGHIESGRNEYASSPEKQSAGGHTAAMHRVADQERDAKKEQEQSRAKMRQEIKDRIKASRRRANELRTKVAEDSNTDKRRQVVNVAREDDDAPESKKSKLTKNAEIKQKIIGEENPMFTKTNFGQIGRAHV